MSHIRLSGTRGPGRPTSHMEPQVRQKPTSSQRLPRVVVLIERISIFCPLIGENPNPYL